MITQIIILFKFINFIIKTANPRVYIFIYFTFKFPINIYKDDTDTKTFVNFDPTPMLLPIISCHCSLETFSFFFISSFATAKFRGCSCCEDKNLAGPNQRPFELTQQTMKLFVTSRAILHLMTAQPTNPDTDHKPSN